MKLFIDRDLGKKLGNALRAVGISATSHIDRYPTADAESIPDSKWVREASAAGEILITRDGRMRRRRSAELAAIVESAARCFVLETGNSTPIGYLRAVMIAWPRIVEIVESEPAPYMYGIGVDGRVTRRYPTAL